MKSLSKRLTLWFGIGFIVIAAAFTVLINHTLEAELLEKACSKAYPDLPDWNLHNTLTDAEVKSIANQLMKSALNYAAKVVHELRTPLSIMRLKVEPANERIAPAAGTGFAPATATREKLLHHPAPRPHHRATTRVPHLNFQPLIFSFNLAALYERPNFSPTTSRLRRRH